MWHCHGKEASFDDYNPVAGEGLCTADCSGIYKISLHHRVALQRTLLAAEEVVISKM